MASNFWSRFGKALASCGLVATLITNGFAAQPAKVKDAKGKDIVVGELIVKFKETATDAEIENGLKRGKLKVKKHKQTAPMKAKGHNGVTLVETELPIDDAIAQLQNDPAIDYVEPNYVYKHHLVSNDTYVTNNSTWGLYSATSSPANAYGAGAMDAWTAGHTGNKSVYVAIIDEGIDVAHPDLAANMWTNPKDPVDGIDNDGNGYVDDAHGWNFYSDNNQVFDSTGDTHGTHVAGTIGAVGGNGKGVAGVNWNVTMISGKFLGADGGDTLAAVEAIDYFVDLKKRHGINLVAINASWGGGGYSRTLHDSIIRAAKAGIIFCAAAGNDALNNDISASYPSNIDTTKGTLTETAASYNGVIAVAAIDSGGRVATFSNYGAKTVHIGAPGVQILSCYPNSQLGYMSGTSMATPHVTGAVALYASTHAGASAQSIRDALIKGATFTPSLVNYTTTGARLNVSQIIKPITPLAAPIGLTATASVGSVQLSWTAAPNATSYVVKRSTTVGGPYTVIATVTTTSFTDATVTPGANYFYVVAAVSSAETSPNSTEVSATPLAVLAPTGVTVAAAQTTVWGASTVTVRWSPAPGAATYKVRRMQSNIGTWADVATVSAVTTTFSQAVTGSANYTFNYQVIAVSSTGQTAAAPSVSVTPISPAPANLVATALSAAEIQLTWVDRSADETGFKIEMWNYPTQAWVQVGSVDAGVTRVNLSAAKSKTTYTFRVRAYNSTWQTAWSNFGTTTTL